MEYTLNYFFKTKKKKENDQFYEETAIENEKLN